MRLMTMQNRQRISERKKRKRDCKKKKKKNSNEYSQNVTTLSGRNKESLVESYKEKSFNCLEF